MSHPLRDGMPVSMLQRSPTRIPWRWPAGRLLVRLSRLVVRGLGDLTGVIYVPPPEPPPPPRPGGLGVRHSGIRPSGARWAASWTVRKVPTSLDPVCRLWDSAYSPRGPGIYPSMLSSLRLSSGYTISRSMLGRSRSTGPGWCRGCEPLDWPQSPPGSSWRHSKW